MRKYIGFKDKDNKKIYLGDKCRMFDSTGKEWIGIIGHDIGNGVFTFTSNYYQIWIHDYKLRELEVIERPKRNLLNKFFTARS